MKKLNVLLILTVFSFLLISSCKNDETEVVDNKAQELKSVKEVVDIQKQFSKTFNITKTFFDKIKKDGPGFGFRDDCPEVTFDSSGLGNFSLILDFGDDCVLEDSIEVSGKITITLYGHKMRKPDSIVTVFDNFSVSGDAMSGTFVVIDKGKDNEGRAQVLYVLRDGHFTKDDGETMTMNFERLHTIDNNGTLADFEDDILYVTGHSSGVTFSGVDFETEITTELVLPFSCGCYVSGVQSISVNGSDVYTLDFGDGTCDKIAILTSPDGSTEEITICD